MLRASALQAVSGYRSRYQWIEDHDLWLRLAAEGRLANLDEILLCYRQHASSVCWQRAELQRTLMNELLTAAYRTQGREVPAGVLADQTVVRSAAGPGKWARMAAKGGFLRCALKHVSLLNRSQATLGYKIRMNMEVAARLLAGIARRRSEAPSPAVPRFTEWHDRLADELELGSQLVAA